MSDAPPLSPGAIERARECFRGSIAFAGAGHRDLAILRVAEALTAAEAKGRADAIHLSNDQIEQVARDVFFKWHVYGGYDSATKEAEWRRMRNIEINTVEAVLATIRTLAPPAPSRHRSGITCAGDITHETWDAPCPRCGAGIDQPCPYDYDTTAPSEE